jgi:hypothetical protein
MSTEDTNDKTTPMSGPAEAAPAAQQNTVSPRKREANRKNAQRSTGPKTPEGKAKSAQNAVTHGIFVRQYLSGGTRDTVDEIKKLAAGFWDHYRPVGMIEEMLVEKLCIETVRYSRVLRLEIDELARKLAFFGPGGRSRWALRHQRESRTLSGDGRARAPPGRAQGQRESCGRAGRGVGRPDCRDQRENPDTGDFFAGRNC